MLNQQDGVLLRRMFSQFLPDVFSHPLWLGFIEAHEPLSSATIQELIPIAGQLQDEGNIKSACQVLFLCAAMQKRNGDYAAALNSILYIWNLAEIHNLMQVSRWAAWGASALCFSLKDEQQAGKHLEWLHQNLTAQGEWVTANLIYLIKSTLLHQTEERPGIQTLLSWLPLWGEINPILDTKQATSDDENSLLKMLPKSGRFLFNSKGGWHSLWLTLKRITTKTLQLKYTRHANLIDDDFYLKAYHPTDLEPISLLSQVARPSSLHLNPNSSSSPVNESLKYSTTSDSGVSTSIALPFNRTSQGPSLVVCCLGPLRIYQNGHLIENWSSKKGLSIFKYLIVHRDSLAQKELLMDTFWPDADTESARRNLHQAIYSLRQTFTPGNSEFQYIQFWNDGYRLNPSLRIWVDYEEFEQHVRSGQILEERKKIESAMAEYGIAEGLYQDDFLIDDPYEEWVQGRRRNLLQTYLSTALRLAQYYLQCKEYAAAIALSRRILSKDNCQEEAHQYLIRCYLEQGQRHLALSQYQLCVKLLQDELGLSPSAETRNLFLQIN